MCHVFGAVLKAYDLRLRIETALQGSSLYFFGVINYICFHSSYIIGFVPDALFRCQYFVKAELLTERNIWLV